MLRPTITERTLKNWRGQALKSMYHNAADSTKEWHTVQERILRMTQELLDQHLLRKEKKE